MASASQCLIITTETMKIVLNLILAKQTSMGGYNVALNFYKQTLQDNDNEWFYFVSKDFDADIKGRENGMDERHYRVFHSQPNFWQLFKEKPLVRHAEEEIGPHVIYSILAPRYHRFKSVEVMRCANAWTVVGGVNKYALSVTPFPYLLRYRLKSWVTRYLMHNTKYFITQTEIAKKCILKTVHTYSENVCVVSNVLSEKYQKACREKISHKGFNMVYISSPSVHKDYLLLPYVALILVKRYDIKDFKIHITLPDYCSSVFKQLIDVNDLSNYFVNHGFLNSNELIDLYRQCDLGLFPSLLETFSATLLEYMYFSLPIVASDLDFNKEVTDNAALYFEPHNAEDMAEKIYQLYSNKALTQVLLDNASLRLSYFTDNSAKYSETVQFLKWVSGQGHES